MSKNKNKINVRYYVVAMIDVLGYRDEIRKLQAIASDGEIRKQADEIIRNTYGKVLTVRRDFKAHFEGYRNQKMPPKFKKLSLEKQQALELIRKCELHVQQFSDSVIAYAPIYPNGNMSMRSVYAMITTCATIMLVELARGIPIRGAIELGIGIEDKNELFGPALLKAYEMEQYVAQYPRIVVGETLLKFMLDHHAHPENTVEGGYQKLMLDLALPLIVHDGDSVPFIDYLNPKFLQHLQADEEQALDKARQFVQAQYDTFLAAKNQKLAARYASLLLYFQTRLDERNESKALDSP